MTCVNHNQIEAVASCKLCGKSFCKDCISEKDKRCYQCNCIKLSEAKQLFIKRVLPSALIFIVSFIFMLSELSYGLGMVFFFSYLLSCIPWVLFYTRDNRKAQALRGIQADASNHLGLNANHASSAAGSVFIAFKSVLIGVFVVPVKTIAILINLITSIAVSKKQSV